MTEASGNAAPRASAGSPPTRPAAAAAESVLAAAPDAATLEAQIAGARPCDIAVGLPTYNNATTLPAVLAAVQAGLARHFSGATAALVNADAGSADGTTDLVAAAGLPAVRARHDAPLPERAAVPFHGVPGRDAAVRLTFAVAHQLGARLVILLEADVTSITEEWIGRLARPVWEEKADLVIATYARHRYDGTITNLLLAPLVRALCGRRLRQPLGGAQALSARLVEHLLGHPRWSGRGRDITDLWIVGTAIGEGFSLWEAWLGRRRVESRTRTADLPAMMVQTVGAVFTLMDRHEDLWREARGSEPVPAVGEPVLPSTEPIPVDVERMVAAFRQGVRDLGSIWELILSPETLGDVLGLEVADPARFRFPNSLWARVVFEFALGHHYGVVHRDHLLRSLVPLYLGRTAAFVAATRDRDAAATEAYLDAVAAAFERQKPYLVERWR